MFFLNVSVKTDCTLLCWPGLVFSSDLQHTILNTKLLYLLCYKVTAVS